MSDPQDFFAPPKPHHHVVRLVILVVVLAVIVLGLWLYSTMSKTGPAFVQPVANDVVLTPAVEVGRALTPAEMAASLRAEAAPSMTEQEKAKVVTDLRKTQSTVSDAEKEAIAKELRGQ